MVTAGVSGTVPGRPVTGGLSSVSVVSSIPRRHFYSPVTAVVVSSSEDSDVGVDSVRVYSWMET